MLNQDDSLDTAHYQSITLLGQECGNCNAHPVIIHNIKFFHETL